MGYGRIFGMTALLLAAPALAARAPKVPKDAPYCAPAGMAQLFLSPMGEPFRAGAGKPYPAAAWIAAADRDRDGAVDRAETAADAARFFATLDRDRDGRLTPEEIDAYERDVAPEIAVYAGGGGPEAVRAPRYRPVRSAKGSSGYGGPLGAGAYAWLNIPEPVAASDADLNRVVDRDEFLAAADRRFTTLAAGRPALRLADMGRTPAQQAAEGPCLPVRKRKGDADEGRPPR